MRLLASLTLVCGVLTGASVAILRVVNPPASAFMLQSERQPVTHRWVPLSDIAPAMQLAVIAAEDQRFATHHGFDVEAIEDAVEDALEGRGSRGASTITQQTAKNLFLWPSRSLVRKALEAYFTLLLEALWPKRRILEVYLNIAELGEGLYGVEAAARRYFKVSARQLSRGQAAQLAGVLPSPRTRDPRRPAAHVAKRVTWILDQMSRLPPDTLERL